MHAHVSGSAVVHNNNRAPLGEFTDPVRPLSVRKTTTSNPFELQAQPPNLIPLEPKLNWFIYPDFPRYGITWLCRNFFARTRIAALTISDMLLVFRFSTPRSDWLFLPRKFHRIHRRFDTVRFLESAQVWSNCHALQRGVRTIHTAPHVRGWDRGLFT